MSNSNQTTNTIDIRKLKKTIISRALILLTLLAALLFIPAGTMRFWQAWVYLAMLCILTLFIFSYFIKRDPELLERRMRTKEKERTQKRILIILWIFLIAAYLISGLDRRFGWSHVPLLLNIITFVPIMTGYLLFYAVLRENRFASRIIEVAQEQPVISTGPYAIVRHPMYSACLLMYLFAPLALGSWWGLLPMSATLIGIVIRILNEEKVLLAQLEGYRAYTLKTRYRLIPWVW